MPIFLPVAGISINVFLIIGLGAALGFLSGLLGVGGGFLMTPILMMIGVPPTVAAASDTNAIVATSSSGVAAHFRLGNVDMKMGAILLAGGLTGAAIGVEVIKVLRSLGNADALIKLTYIVVLGFVGGFMFIDSVRNLRRGSVVVKSSKRPGKTSTFLSRLPLQMKFPRSRVQHSVLVPFFLCAIVGVLAAIMGVGGGFIMVPAMIYIIGMPTTAAIGTDLFQIVLTSANVTLQQAFVNKTVDLLLALILLGGSTIGAQFGAMAGKRLKGEQIRILLAIIVLVLTVKIFLDLVITPSDLVSLAPAKGGGH